MDKKKALEDLCRTSEFQDYFFTQRLAFDLAMKIRGKREEMHLTQVELAKKMGVPQSTIARLERGTRNPGVALLEKFCKATGTRLTFENSTSLSC